MSTRLKQASWNLILSILLFWIVLQYSSHASLDEGNSHKICFVVSSSNSCIGHIEFCGNFLHRLDRVESDIITSLLHKFLTTLGTFEFHITYQFRSLSQESEGLPPVLLKIFFWRWLALLIEKSPLAVHLHICLLSLFWDLKRGLEWLLHPFGWYFLY